MVRNRERGGAVKPILFLGVLVYGVFCALKVVPAKSDDKAMERKVAETLRFAGVNQLKNAKEIQGKLNLEAKGMGIPIEEKDIKIEDLGQEWGAKLSWTREIDLILFKHKYTFKIDTKVVKG